MKRSARLPLLLLLLGCLAGLSPRLVQAADFAVIVKSGTVSLWDTDQLLDSADRDFNRYSHRTLALNWEIRTNKEVALGMEYLTFRHDFTPSDKGTTKTEIVQFTVKKYFSPAPVLHPYFGLGLGWGYGKFDDGVGNVDRDYNAALSLSTGIEFRIGENVGLYTEVKGLVSGADNQDDNEFNCSGTGYFAGVSFIF